MVVVVVVWRVEIVLDIDKDGPSSLSDGRSRVKHLMQLCEARMENAGGDCAVDIGREFSELWSSGGPNGIPVG